MERYTELAPDHSRISGARLNGIVPSRLSHLQNGVSEEADIESDDHPDNSPDDETRHAPTSRPSRHPASPIKRGGHRSGWLGDRFRVNARISECSKAQCACVQHTPWSMTRSRSTRKVEMPDEVKTRRSRRPGHDWPLSMSLAPLSLRVFPFKQTHLDNTRQISRLNKLVR